MAITRKPTRPSLENGSTVDVEALINKGGSAPVRAQEAKPAQGTASIILRLPATLLEQVDALLKARPVKIPRHTWLLEAVYEKIRKESEYSSNG